MINLILFDTLWGSRDLGSILISVRSNSHFEKQLVARRMTTLGSVVGNHIPNIGYMKVCGRVWKHIGYIWEHMKIYGDKYMCTGADLSGYMMAYGSIQKFMGVYGGI